jgi:hypothetical protein
MWAVAASIVVVGSSGTARGEQQQQQRQQPAPQPVPTPGAADPAEGGPAAPPPPVDPVAAAVAAEKEQRALELRALREEMQRALIDERAHREAEAFRLRADMAALTEQAAALRQQIADAPPGVRAARAGLGLTGFIQADLAFRQSSEDQLNPSTGDPLNEDRFMIRRARLRATLDRTYVAGAFELDGSTVRGPAARIAGAEASLKYAGRAPAGTAPGAPPLIMATIGLFKIPFGFEVVESDRDRLFLERSTVARALFPGEYDVGARLQGGWRFLRYALAVQNGDPVGERAFPGRDPNHQKDFVGRVGVDASDGPLAVNAGFSALYGTGLHKGTPATKPSIQWVDTNEDGIVDTNEQRAFPGMSATPSINFARHGLGADLRIALKGLAFGDTTVSGELYYARDLDRALFVADPTGAVGAVGRSYRELGWYVAVMQDLGAHATVGARYDVYQPDRDASDRQAGVAVPNDVSLSTLALVAALRGPAGRLIVEYDVNRNHQGRDAAGVPTNLADNAFTIRGEARF